MKTLRLIVVSMIFAAFLAVSAIAQVSPAAKIALIDTQSFYETTGGITKILNGYKRLQTELKPEADKYQAKITQFNTLKKAYDALVLQAREGKVPVNPADIQSKEDQLTVLQTDIKRMQEDLKAKQDKREAEIIGPIVQEVGKSIETFAKQKGYTLVLDVGRMANAQMLLFIDDKTNITKEFITFYNAATPAGTATK